MAISPCTTPIPKEFLTTPCTEYSLQTQSTLLFYFPFYRGTMLSVSLEIQLPLVAPGSKCKYLMQLVVMTVWLHWQATSGHCIWMVRQPRNVNMFCRLLLASHPFLLGGRSPAPIPNPLGNKKNRKGEKKQKSKTGERGNLIFLANPDFFLACFLMHCGKKW